MALNAALMAPAAVAEATTGVLPCDGPSGRLMSAWHVVSILQSTARVGARVSLCMLKR